MLLPVTVRRFAVDLSRAQQFAQHRRHAAGAVEALAEIFSGRLHVDEQRDVARAHPVLRRDVDAGMARHGIDVRLGVGRSAERGDAAMALRKAARVRIRDGRRSS